MDAAVIITTNEGGIIRIAKYENNPAGALPTGFTVLGKYIDVWTDIPENEIVWPIELRIYYTDAEVAAAGIPEGSLRIFWWNGSEWVPEENSGVNAENNYVWAKVRHLTLFAPLGFHPEVEVTISPENTGGLPGELLSYVVTVINTGPAGDNYSLTVDDNAGWNPSISPTLLTVPAGENRTATLTVTVPTDALYCIEDNIQVIARSGIDNTVSADDFCIAHVKAVRGVKVSISPSYKGGKPGSVLDYTITVKNEGNIVDTYILTADYSLDWELSISPTLLTIMPCENDTATLTVTIPEGAVPPASNNILIVVTSTENDQVKDNDSCTTYVFVKRVEVSISPDNRSGAPGTTLTYSVTINNAGSVDDSYLLTVDDNLGWGPSVSPSSLSIPAGGNATATLTVTIPANADNCTRDEIYVIATSTSDPSVDGGDTCIAHAMIIRGVDVNISPSYKSSTPGATINYLVWVKNIGNVSDTYTLTVDDNAGWNPSISPTSLTVPAGENRSATLSVIIPENAAPYTEDNIRVTATGTDVSNFDTCIARATVVGGVEVWISPSYGRGAQGSTLTFILLVKNSSNLSDNYVITAIDNQGWGLQISPTSLLVPAGENRSATLMVTIPDNVPICTRDNILVTVSGMEMGNSSSCIAHVAPLYDVEVFIVPSENRAPPGATLVFIVMIKNTGLVSDTYSLKLVGDASWSPRIESTSLTLEPGASGETTLTVVVPPDVGEGASTTMSIIVTSAGDPTISAAGTCSATATAVEEVSPTVLIIISVVVIATAIVTTGYLLRGARGAWTAGSKRRVFKRIKVRQASRRLRRRRKVRR
jgi:uncharacterized membrane protein